MRELKSLIRYIYGGLQRLLNICPMSHKYVYPMSPNSAQCRSRSNLEFLPICFDKNEKTFSPKGCWAKVIKVQKLWEGDKIWKNLPLFFNKPKDFFSKLWGLLRISKLYELPQFRSSKNVQYVAGLLLLCRSKSIEIHLLLTSNESITFCSHAHANWFSK